MSWDTKSTRLFGEFVSWAQQKNRRILILSDGLGFYIELLLAKYGIPIPTYYSNQAEFEGNRIRIHYPYFHQDCTFACECGNCKPLPHETLSRVASRHDRRWDLRSLCGSIGGSDLCKNLLADYCEQQTFPFFRFNDFCDIIRQEEKVSWNEESIEFKKAQNDL